MPGSCLFARASKRFASLDGLASTAIATTQIWRNRSEHLANPASRKTI